MTIQLVLSLITIAGLALVYFEISKVAPSIQEIGKTASTVNKWGL